MCLLVDCTRCSEYFVQLFEAWTWLVCMLACVRLCVTSQLSRATLRQDPHGSTICMVCEGCTSSNASARQHKKAEGQTKSQEKLSDATQCQSALCAKSTNSETCTSLSKGEHVVIATTCNSTVSTTLTSSFLNRRTAAARINIPQNKRRNKWTKAAEWSWVKG